MAKIRSFRALRPTPEKASQVAAVPYDVVNRQEALELAKGNPLSFLHVSRAEIDLPESTNPYSEQVYAKAKESFRRLIDQAPLVRESEPALYVYQLEWKGRAQTGILGTFSIDEYDSGVIKRHEKTRKDKEDDRTRHVVTLQAQTGPVFLTYRGRDEIREAVQETLRERPLFSFTAVDGVSHRVWKIRASLGVEALFESIPSLYIADGHHRAASASRARAELRAANPSHAGDEDYNFMLAVAFPAEELRILPYHRVVKDLNGLSEVSFLERVKESFNVTTEEASAEPRHSGEYSMYLGRRWLRLSPIVRPKAESAIARLDVSILQDFLLEPVLGIRDPRTDSRIDFVGGIRGTGELERLVNSGKAAVAFSMFPTTLDQLFAVSDAGEIMPPKSTWFEPKLRDGIASHLIGVFP